jgi:hypothetical protein
MPQYLSPHEKPYGTAPFSPESLRDTGSGLRPSFKAVLAHLDMDAPEWPSVAAVLSEMRSAGIELTEEIACAARKIGAQRWADRQRNDTRDSAAKLGTACGPGSIVYYIRRGELIKIGTTTDPVTRFATLLPDEVLAAEPGGQPEEYLRHRQFRHLRRHGEYFEMADELMAHVLAVREAHGEPDPAWPTWAAPGRPWAEDPGRASAELITVAEAQRRYGISRYVITNLVRRGVIRPVGKDGRSFLYFADELMTRAAA